MTAFALRQTVEHLPFNGEGRDPRGNVVETWADPVAVRVYGWHTGSSHEPQIAGHDRTVVEGQVFGPESWRPSTRDRVVLPGAGTYEVIGEPEDYNHGPFGWRPGLVTNLKKTEG